MAEREGFEPSVPLLAVHAISSRAPSASSDISPVLYCQLRCELLANLAERVGFEPTCPAIHRTNRFRVDPVTTTSVPLRNFPGGPEKTPSSGPGILLP